MFPVADTGAISDGMNPIKIARASENLTQTRLAHDLMISRSFLIRVEHGVYKTPGAELLSWAANILSATPAYILEWYKQYQKHKRQLTLDDVNIESISAPVPAEDQNQKFSSSSVTTRIYTHEVFKKWRENYWMTTNDFCVAMCVHPDSVTKYENGDMLHMPEQLLDVLRETNLLGNIEYTMRWYYV